MRGKLVKFWLDGRVVSVRLFSFPLLFLVALCSSAQDTEHPYTIFVTTRLLQIPTLVLSNSLKPLKPIPADRFTVSLDQTKPFSPENVRLEGEDPLSLGILVDTSGGESSLLAQLPDALAELVPGSLHPQDEVTIFTINCELMNHTKTAGANAAELKAATKSILSAPVPSSNEKSPCRDSSHVVDGMAVAMKTMSEWPGRRVLLTISDGRDGGSHLRLENLKLIASRFAVTIFGMDQSTPLRRRATSSTPASTPQAFTMFCEQTGGLVLSTDQGNLTESLKNFISMLRGRYVIEFHWPGDVTSGMHTIQVKLRGMSALIHAAGASQPVGNSRTATSIQQTPPAADNSTVPAVPATPIKQ